MKWLWVTDAWTALDHASDTTLRLIEEARAQGDDCEWCELGAIRWDGTRAEIDARRVVSITARTASGVTLAERRRLAITDLDRIVFRPDVITRGYVHTLQLLCVELERHGRDPESVIVNPPSVLLGRNEKLQALSLGRSAVASCVSSERESLLAFARAEGRVVLKPLHLHQSQGVELLDVRAPDGEALAEARLREATASFTRPVLVQRFLERFATRERRLWFCDGHLIGAAAKVPADLAFPPNPETTTIAAATLDEGERASADAIGRALLAQRIRMAGVDVLDGSVTEVNMVSPGLLVEIESVHGANLAARVVASLREPLKSCSRPSASPRSAPSPD